MSARSAACMLLAGIHVIAGCAGCGDDNGMGGPDVDAAPPVDSAPMADAATEIGCDPYVPRQLDTTVFVGPNGLENTLLGLVGSAERELWIMMYVITLDSFVDAIIAAQARGVDVRVLLDATHPGNVDSRATLLAAGVAVRDAPASFTFAHSKVLLIDSETAVIMSGNLTFSAMTGQRNHGAIDRDPEDIADLRAIFESDWTAEGYPDLACTRLVVSPINTRARLLGHINRAQSTLDLEVLYISDQSILNALVERRDAGVNVRVLLSHPVDTPENQATADMLSAQGMDVRFQDTPDVHAKLVIADGVPLVGSQNLSFTSINDNREIGLVVTTEAAATQLGAAFETDWSNATAPRVQ